VAIPYNNMFVMYPPRPGGSSRPEDILTYPGWWSQRKFNGTRTLVFVSPSGEIHLRNRKREPHKAYKLTDTMRRAWEPFSKTPNWNVFDGELLHSKTSNVKDRIVLFDLLVHAGSYLTGTTYEERYRLLYTLCGYPENHEDSTGSQLALWVNDHVWLAETFETPESLEEAILHFREKTDLDEIEGLVLKDPGGKLKPGVTEDNNSGWMIRVRKEHKNYKY